MEKVTLTIEGTSEEVFNSLRRLVAIQVQQDEAAGVSWLPDEIEGLFGELQPEAQRILREIAKKPQDYDRDGLLDKMGITGRGMAGRLSSIGHNRNRDYPMKPAPVELDWATRSYKMLPEFADWINDHPADE